MFGGRGEQRGNLKNTTEPYGGDQVNFIVTQLKSFNFPGDI